MIKSVPALELRANYLQLDRYLLKDKAEFTNEDCVVAIADVVRSSTFEEQKSALAIGIIGVAGQLAGLEPLGNGRASGLHISKFRISEGLARLVSLKLPRARIGYQTPDESCPNPAFAVIDIGSYHRVVRRPDEELGVFEAVINHDVAVKLAAEMNRIRPSFEIFDRLQEQDVNLRSF